MHHVWVGSSQVLAMIGAQEIHTHHIGCGVSTRNKNGPGCGHSGGILIGRAISVAKRPSTEIKSALQRRIRKALASSFRTKTFTNIQTIKRNKNCPRYHA